MQTLPFYIMFNIVTLLPVLNSLFNPPIYAVRIRYFRVAFIQLLARKTFAHAEQLEICLDKDIVASAEQGENRVSRGSATVTGISGDSRKRNMRN